MAHSGGRFTRYVASTWPPSSGFTCGGARDLGQRPLLGRMARVQPGRVLLRFDERIVDDRMIRGEREIQILGPLADRIGAIDYRANKSASAESGRL